MEIDTRPAIEYNEARKRGESVADFEALKARYLSRIEELRLMDDDFFRVCMQDNKPAVELIVRIILDDDGLVVKAVTTQKEMKSLLGHSLSLDVFAVSKTGERIDVKIQRSDAGTVPERAAYHSGTLDANSLPKGEKDFTKKAETYCIFITEHDVLGAGRPLYRVERMIDMGDGYRPFGGKSHIIYVNGAYEGDTPLARLMHDFRCKNPDEMNFAELRERARYFKRESEGMKAMCKVMEDIMREGEVKGSLKKARSVALDLLKRGQMSMEDIAAVVGLPVADVQAMAAAK